MKYINLSKLLKIVLFSLIIALIIKGYKYYNDNIYYFNSFKKVEHIVPDESLLHELTILTPSFDTYSEVWPPYYKLLFKNWPELLDKYKFIPMMLITNELGYDDPRVQTLKVGADTSWSANMLKGLESVKTKYVFIYLDDYITYAPVDQNRFLELLTLLDQTDGSYAEIGLDERMIKKRIEKNMKFTQGLNGVIYRSKKSPLRTALQACIWNVSDLKSLLDPKESAWEFEGKGGSRSKKSNKPFYMVVQDPPVKYLNAAGGRMYEKNVIDYINSQGVDFAPKKLPIRIEPKTKESYLNEEEFEVLGGVSK